LREAYIDVAVGVATEDARQLREEADDGGAAITVNVPVGTTALEVKLTTSLALVLSA
jgi:hypothetical protein